MKHFIKISLPLALVVGFTPPCFGLSITMCLSLEDCTSQIKSGLGSEKYCCPTGETKTQLSQTCPLGWTLVGTECTRATVTGSNARGTYTTTYGTCAPTSSTTTITCYAPSTSGTTSDGVVCHAASGI